MYLHRQRFTIYRRTQELVDGEEVTTLSKVAEIWGKIRSLRASEQRVTGSKPEEFSDSRFYCSPYADIAFRDLIDDGTTTFRVQTDVPRKGIGDNVEIDCITDPQAKVEIEAL